MEVELEDGSLLSTNIQFNKNVHFQGISPIIHLAAPSSASNARDPPAASPAVPPTAPAEESRSTESSGAAFSTQRAPEATEARSSDWGKKRIFPFSLWEAGVCRHAKFVPMQTHLVSCSPHREKSLGEIRVSKLLFLCLVLDSFCEGDLGPVSVSVSPPPGKAGFIYAGRRARKVRFILLWQSLEEGEENCIPRAPSISFKSVWPPPDAAFHLQQLDFQQRKAKLDIL